MWRLKQDHPAFELVDGPMAGMKFVHGETYEQVPPAHTHRFETMAEERGKESTRTAGDAAQKARKKEQANDEEMTDVEQPR